MDKVNLNEKFKCFSEHWSPKIVGELNGQYIKLVKVQGDFVWHQHDDEDEMFLVVKGALDIELRDKVIHLEAGEFFIVPKGVEHRPVTKDEAHIILIEPKKTQQTGGVESDLLVEKQDWI